MTFNELKNTEWFAKQPTEVKEALELVGSKKTFILKDKEDVVLRTYRKKSKIGLFILRILVKILKKLK